MMLWKCCTQYANKFGKLSSGHRTGKGQFSFQFQIKAINQPYVKLVGRLTQQWPQDWKRAVFTPIPKKGDAKECSNYHTIALISHASKLILKITQARLQQYVNCELLDVHAGFRKGRGTRDQIANIRWIMEKPREFQKNIYFCFLDYAKAFDYVDHN